MTEFRFDRLGCRSHNVFRDARGYDAEWHASGIRFYYFSIVGFYFYLGIGSLSLLATSSFSSIGQFALIPIPLFILMGELLLRTGLASRTVEAVDQWIGRLPGRLSLSSVGGGTLFGA